MKEYKIEFVISEGDFEHTFARKPVSETEFEEFCHLCEKGLKNGHIDWDIVLSCAKEAMTGD